MNDVLVWTIWPSPVATEMSSKTWEIRLSDLGIDNGGIVDADYGSALLLP